MLGAASGAVAGLVTFVSYGNATYQILGYTPVAGLSQYDAVFRQTMASFGQLTDASALNVRAAKVELVRVPRAMTIAEFNSRMHSATSPPLSSSRRAISD